MEIKGWVHNSLIDYPDHIAAVIFSGGCNFRCPMCHNADLVLHYEDIRSVNQHEFFGFLEKRAGLIDGLVVSGGEPTLQDGLIPFLKRVKEWDYDIKLDTNGTRPDVILETLRCGCVDFIALDIKAPPDKYSMLTGLPRFDPNVINHSLKIIVEAQIPFELRTTVVPQFLDIGDIAALTQWIAPSFQATDDRGSYVLQQFRALHTLDPNLSNCTSYTKEHLDAMADTARQWLPRVKVRGA